MTPIDQKTELHYRQCAINMAMTTHGDGMGNGAVILATANDFYEFMIGNRMSAEPGQMLVSLRNPSGMPEDWTGPAPLPADTLDSVMAEELTVPELQEKRRRLLFELDVTANALRARGVVPC